MKLLLIHADEISWEPTKKAIKSAEDAEKHSGSAKEALVAFAAVEKADEQDPKSIAAKGVAEILDVLGQVKAERIVLYPYAHLSSTLSNPSTAVAVLKEMEHELRDHQQKEVLRAPFGWYKALHLKAKGHPLAELSRDVSLEQRVKPVKQKAGKIILDRSALPPHDHRILGEDLKIFHLAEEIGSGLPLWMPYGATIKHLLMEFMRAMEETYGYKYVDTPHIAKGDVYRATGHLPYYKDSMYPPIDIEGSDYYLKPMNCPHHHMIFKKLVRSYRDLPLRLAEPGTTYRNELSGVTYGLIRVRGFTQNDAHIYVTPGQLKEEFKRVLQLFQEVYKVMRIIGYWFRLSLPDFEQHPDKFTGDPAAWSHACDEIRAAMKESGVPFVEEKGEAAFYGPKIDVQIKNSLGKEETIATSQVDIVVPSRLGLAYTDKDDQKKPVIVIHRAILGSYERFVAYLLEQTKGALPMWLAPVQARVLSFTERNVAAAERFVQQLRQSGIRAETDTSAATVNAKVRDAELQKIPYILVIGDREEKEGTVAVRARGQSSVTPMPAERFIAQAQEEIRHRK